MHKLLITIRRVVVAILTAIAFWTLLLMIFEDKFVFFPLAYPSGSYEDARFIPGLEEHSIRTSDGLLLHAWYAPADSPKAVVLHSHGNGGNLSYSINWVRRLQRVGLSVLAYDYRGYGKSEGAPSETGVIIDALAAYDYLRDSLKIPPSKIIIWGTSLGGAVSVQLAAQRPAAGLILESTFTSASDVAERTYPFLPVRWLMRTSFRSVDTIRALAVPTLHIHGDQDEVIDVELGRLLYDAAPGPKEWYGIPGAGHNDTYLVGDTDYLRRIVAFVRHYAVS